MSEGTIHSRLPLSATIPRPRLGMLYMMSVPFLAAIGAMRGDGLSIAGFNYTGFLWTIALVAGGLLLIVEKGLRPENWSYFPLAPWLLWITVLFASLTWADDPELPQVRDAVQQSMPILVGILGGLFVQSREGLRLLMNAFYFSVPILWCFSLLWCFTDLDEEFRTDMYVEKRAVALTAVLIGGLFITGTKREFVRGWVGWSLCLGVTVVTGSRTASLAMLMLPILDPTTRNPGRKLAAIGTIGLVATAVFLTPTFQERFFRGESGGVNKIAQGDFDSAGRFDAWPQVYERFLERPWLGHGVGTVQRYIPTIWKNVQAAHNDYLRVAYEQGILGLVIFVPLLIWQLWSLASLIRRTDGEVQQFAGAAWLGLSLFVLIAFTDNPLTYTLCYMDPLLTFIGVAYSVARYEQLDPRSASRLVNIPGPAHSATGLEHANDGD